MTANLVTPDNCPRDPAGLGALSRAVRYRLALGLALFANESPEEQAFIGAPDDVQIQTLMTGLQAKDAAAQNGQPIVNHQQPQYQQPPQQQQQPPQQQPPQYQPPPPMAPPPQMGQPGATPQPLAVAPAQYTGQPQAFNPQPGYQQQPAPQMPPPYSPPQAPMQAHPQVPQAAPPPPPNGGYAPPPAYGAPPPMAGPGMPPPGMMPPAPYQPPQQQHPQYQPPAPQQPPPQYQPQQQQTLPAAPPPMMRQPSTAGDPRNAGQQSDLAAMVKELEQTVLGMARTQNMMLILLLELGRNQLGMDKQTLARMLVQYAQGGEPERFFDPAGLAGKVG